MNFTGPIYEGGALRAQKRQAVAFWEQTKLQYEQTALNAFTDVSNALISRQEFEAIRAEQARSVAAYQEAVTVSLQRYTAGKASYFEVLDAQIQLHPEQNSLAQTEINRRQVVVQLYLALGGGWNLTDSDGRIRRSHRVQPQVRVRPRRVRALIEASFRRDDLHNVKAEILRAQTAGPQDDTWLILAIS